MLNTTEAKSAFKDLLEQINTTAKTTVQEFEAIAAAWQKIKGFFGGEPSQNREFTPGLSGGTLGPKPALDASKLQGRVASIRQQLELLDRNPDAADYARKRDRMTEELKRVGDELQKLRESGGASVSPSSFGGPGDGAAKILSAAYSGDGKAILWGSRGALGRGSAGALSEHRGALSGGSEDHDISNATRGSRGSVSGQAPLASQGPVPSSQAAREQRAMARLVARGWTPEGAASALGQAATESHVRSDGPLGDTARFGTGDDAAHGMFQWRGSRFRALKAFAAARGKHWQDFDTQVDFFDHETKSRPTARERNWRSETDLYRGNETGKVFEGYSGPLQQQRFRDAQRILGGWNRGPRPTVPTEGGTMFGEISGPTGGMSRLRDTDIDTPGSGDRAGDQAMRRLYGDQALVARSPTQHHSMSIDVTGLPFGARTPKVQMSDLFNEVRVSKGRQADPESI